MKSISLVADDKTEDYEGIQQLVYRHHHAQVKNEGEEGYDFRIGSLVTFVVTGIPTLIEGKIRFRDEKERTIIDISFGKSKLWTLIVVQTVLILLVGFLLSFIWDPTIIIGGVILIAILAGLLDYYYVIKLEEDFVYSLKSGRYRRKISGANTLYWVGTVGVFVLIILVIVLAS